MSKKVEEQKYFEKLDISILPIDEIKELIKTNIRNTFACWKNGKKIEKITFHIIGPAGVGKTQIAGQIAEEMAEEMKVPWGFIPIKGPVIARDDVVSPFPQKVNEKLKFKMLYSDFVPDEENSFGIFLIDELGRGDHNLQQLMWQVQNEYKIHLQKFPEGWFVISTDNPDDQEYSVDIIQDAAGLRRTLHIYTEVNHKAFLKFAVEKEFYPAVIEYITIHPEFLYDFESQKVGRVYSNPASWEKVSDILWGFHFNGGVLKNLKFIEPDISGLLNTSSTRMFIEYLKERKDISPRDIIFSYDKVRKELAEFILKADNAKLSMIMSSVLTFMTVEMPKLETNELNNLTLFLIDLPKDIAATYMIHCSSLSKTSKEFLYFSRIYATLIKKNPTFVQDFYNPMDALAEKAARGK